MNPNYYNSGGYQQEGYPPEPQQQQYPPHGQPGYGQSPQQYQQGSYPHSGGPPEPQQPQYPPYGQPEYGQRPQQYQQDHSAPPPSYSSHENPGSYDQGYPTQHDSQGGPDGERGVMGALAGGAAGAFGGHKIGGKVGHSKMSTVIGAVAGAIAGHKLQDAVSDRKEEREEERHKYQEGYHHAPPDHHYPRHHDEGPRGGNLAGSFTASSRDIRLDGEYNLYASCRRPDGSYQQSMISLNRILENDGGSFRWAAGLRGGGPSTMTVQQGDTLRSIAARFNCSFEDVARYNNISNPDMIYPGQVLQIPGGGGGSGGNFGSSARNVRLVEGGRRLEGELLRDGHWVQSSIVLDERIGNENGTLQLV